MNIEEIGKKADEALHLLDITTMNHWLQERRKNYNKKCFGLCNCGQPANKEYNPYCSYLCWRKVNDQ